MPEGLQSYVETASLPVIPKASWSSSPAVWAYIWFVLAVVIVLGFHVRVFGRAVPPAAKFP